MGATLENGSRVGGIGGGPAGSLFAYFLLTFAQRIDLDVRVDMRGVHNDPSLAYRILQTMSKRIRRLDGGGLAP